MKKSKTFRSVALVGLSAVLAGGVAMTAAGCGGGGGGGANSKANEIVVSMFSSNADKATNQKIADDWAAEYNAKNNTEFTVTISNNTDKAEYFNKLPDEFSKGTIGDVMYLAPRNVKTYAKSGRVIDLTQFIAGDPTLTANIDDVWPNALAYYGFDTTMPVFSDTTYTMGQTIDYQADGAQGAGFYTASGSKVGLYGLPKDYSNFSMGFNRIFFSDDMKEAYTTTKVNADRYVFAGQGDKQSNSTGKLDAENNLVYSADTGIARNHSRKPVISYAVTDASKDIQAGQAANIINPGIPVNILPFNFYMWSDYSSAFAAGDPIAMMTEYFTNGDGYTVTIPGFPDEEFDMPAGAPKDANAPYDTSKGHIVYTYAEYGALMWSLTYYLNTFAWDKDQNPLTTTEQDPGKGGIEDSSGAFRTVYGGEQYEGGEQDGFQLYVLPWLYSNDADLINVDNTFCTSSNGTYSNTQLLQSQDINLENPADWASIAGNATDTVKKLRLNGEYEDVAVQYGLNSKNFIETYGAFLATGSDWNANPNDSSVSEKEGSGWLYFREGRSIFYGAGTWDSAVRNEEDKANVDLGQMPTPVAEKFALYSYVKDANYNMVSYSNGADMNNKNGTPATAEKGTVPTSAFTQEQIYANQVCRQDKWGARMDSVGYAVTNKSLSGGQPTAKTIAAASLCAALTISEKPQIALTYGGAQLPNFISQCKELLGYQSDEYKTTGAFKDMITPDGDAEGNDVWDQYYAIAKEMGDAAYKNQGGTVEQFLADKTIKLDNGTTVAVKYDADFKDVNLDNQSFAAADTTAKSRYSFAMKVLQMVAFRKSDFDLLIRMQYGLNSVRDSSMYTYDDDWLDAHDARAKTENNLCYYRARPLLDANNNAIDLTDANVVKRNTKGAYNISQFLTPFVWCMTQASEAQNSLKTAITKEVQELINAGVTA